MVSDRHRLEETFWRRHSNPKSGWSRTVVLPALLYAIYHREWKMAAAVVAFTVLNPLLFSPPETDEAWMTRVVLAERWWKDRDRGVLGITYPNVLNTVNIPVTLYAIFAASRRQPLRTALAGAGSMLLKFWYVGELVREYDVETDR
ncbi:DUF6653 family protein [Natrinema versiforme]|uniref:Uncharacterized protein n=1 Tax=Natrinema versiforme JCM 10478 TaxID=1227496 RepID=L9XNY5_9EURY|nr:DUF6653 family protein [Natrinema versiforme]ELY63121.1 hypothetical protein C489_19936 [Natrinema versiforme JCM 10478]